MNEKTKEFRQKIADAFISSLEENQLNWQKQWNGTSMMPFNAVNMNKYKGLNKFWLYNCNRKKI